MIFICFIISLHLVSSLVFGSSGQSWVRVEDFGYSYGSSLSTVLVFYVELFNEGHSAVKVEVKNEECCLTIETDDVECETMKLPRKIATLEPLGSQGSTNRLEFMFHSMYIMNRAGVCTFYVIDRRHGHEERIRIPFDTIMHTSTTCSSVDQDIERNCQPANCLLKYMGKRNFFNKSNLRCEPVIECMTLSADRTEIIAYYNPETNQCVDLDEGISAVESAEEDDSAFQDDLMNEKL